MEKEGEEKGRVNKMKRKAKKHALFWKEAGIAMQLSWQGYSSLRYPSISSITTLALKDPPSKQWCSISSCFSSSYSSWPFMASIDRAALVNIPFHWKGKKMFKGGCDTKLPTSSGRQKKRKLEEKAYKEWQRWRKSEAWRCSFSKVGKTYVSPGEHGQRLPCDL